MKWARQKSGFTIVELLIVIVVIAILTAITVIAYNGIQERTKASAVASSAAQANTKIRAHAIQNAETYPSQLSDINIADTDTIDYYYYVNNTATPKYFCLSAEMDGASPQFVSSRNESPIAGSCEGLVGWWPFNGTTDDYSENNYPAANGGAVPAEGQNASSGAYFFNVFDGIRIYNFNHPVQTAGSINGDWSLSAWAYADANSMNETIIVGRSGCHGGLYTYNNNYTFALKSNLANCWTNSTTVGGPATTPGWRHLVAVYSAGTMTLYVDGALDSTGIYNTTTPFGYGSTLYLGGVGGRQFIGKIDDVRVFTRALTATEIQGMHQGGAH